MIAYPPLGDKKLDTNRPRSPLFYVNHLTRVALIGFVVMLSIAPSLAFSATIQHSATFAAYQPSMFRTDSYSDCIFDPGTSSHGQCYTDETWFGISEVPQFDSELGELTSVSVEAIFFADVTAGTDGQEGYIPNKTYLYLDMDFAIYNGPSIYSSRYTVNDFQDECDPTCSLNWMLNNTIETVFTDDAYLFIGTETLAVYFQARVDIRGILALFYQEPRLEGTLVTTYTYTPVPEPGTGAMLGVGMLVLGLGRRITHKRTD